MVSFSLDLIDRKKRTRRIKITPCTCSQVEVAARMSKESLSLGKNNLEPESADKWFLDLIRVKTNPFFVSLQSARAPSAGQFFLASVRGCSV